MILATLLAVTLSTDGSSGAELPNSFAMYVAVLEPMAVTGSVGGTTTTTPISGALRLGAIVGGRHALLAGISFATTLAGSSGGSTTLSFMPTYRFHFSPLAAGAFSPYLQGELFVGYATTSTGGGASLNTVPFGFGGGFGGEYLVMRNFGVTAGAGLRFIHSETSFGGAVSQTFNQIGLYLSAGLALHL